MRAASGARLALLLALTGCTTFPVIDVGTCGNAVVERGEACDTFGNAEHGEICRAAGTVGECQYDCRLNGDGTRARCPVGRGCAADGICRAQVVGAFDTPVKFSSDASSWVSSADFDGDGRADVISSEPADQFQQARFRLHYFDVDAKLIETRTFPRATTPPTARDVDGDHKLDLVFTNFRVGLVPGRADRQFIPASFSSYVVDSGIRVVSVNDDVIGGGTPLAALTALDGVNGIYVPDAGSGALGLRARLPAPLSQLAGPPLAANLIEGRDSPCDEVVVAYRRATSFKIYDMCMPGSPDAVQTEVLWRDAPRQHLVHLPAGLEIDAGPLVGDLDGDGHLDILIGSGGHPYLVRGDGKQLDSVATNLHLELVVDEMAMGFDSPEIEMPLAIGDFSGDGVADFVTPELLFATRLRAGGAQYLATYQNRGQPWTMAEVADLNGNGLLDVVAASDGSRGLSFMSGTGGKYLVGTTLSTAGPIHLLTTGDFDGDLLQDVAVLEQGPPSSHADALAIAFGNRDAPPSTPAHVADLSGVEQLGAFPEFGVDSLFAASDEQAASHDSAKLTLFEGSADRLPLAPYTLVTFSSNRLLQDSLALSLSVGAFARKGSSDVLALGTQDGEEDWTFWLLPNIGGGRDQPRQLAADLPSDMRPIDFMTSKTVGAAGIAADVDGDGQDEAVWLISRGEKGCSLIVYSVDAKQSWALQRSRIDLAETCPEPQLAASDVNRDGLDGEGVDLLALAGDPRLGARKLSIFWNDRAGGFSSAESSSVSPSDAADVRGFGVFERLPGVALVTANTLYTARPLSDARQLDNVDAVATFRDLRSVTVTDPTGDGIEDIVVADAEGLWLVQAKLR